MIQHRLSCILLTGLFACQQKQIDNSKQLPNSLVNKASLIQPITDTPGPASTAFLIIPGRQVGPVNAAATEASLIALLGAPNVRRDTIYVAEGSFDIGTTLFKNTANQAQILWADKRRFARPESVLLRPARDENNNPLSGPGPNWVTNTGVRIGMSLREVEKLNGRAFALYGFGWDYGGFSADWKGGTFDRKDGKTFIGLGFGVSESLSEAHEKLYESLMGDQEFLSNHPAMRKLNPTIQTLTISF